MNARVVQPDEGINNSYDLIAAALNSILTEIGFQSRVLTISEFNQKNDPSQCMWFFVLRNGHFKQLRRDPPNGLKIIFNDERLEPVLKNQVIHFDHIDVPIRMRALPDLERFPDMRNRARIHARVLAHRCLSQGFADVVFEYNPHNLEFWKDRGIPSIFVPIGWHKAFRFEKRQSDVFENAVFFLGHMPMRRRHMRSLLENVGVRLIHNRTPLQRNLLSRTNVGIHIGYLNGYNIFPDRRMALLASSGCLIVSEMCDWTPFSEDEWIETGYEDMSARCREAIDGKYDGMEKRSEEIYRTKFRFDDHVRRALEILGVS